MQSSSQSPMLRVRESNAYQEKGCSEANNGMDILKVKLDRVYWSLRLARVEKSQHLVAGLGIKMRHKKSPCKDNTQQRSPRPGSRSWGGDQTEPMCH